MGSSSGERPCHCYRSVSYTHLDVYKRQAKQYLSMVRNRAFASTSEANVDGFISKCGSVLDAVLEERKLEFGGEHTSLKRCDSFLDLFSDTPCPGIYTFD